MQKSTRGSFASFLIALVLGGAIVAIVVYRKHHPAVPEPTPERAASATTQRTKPAKIAGTKPADAPRDSAFLDVVRTAYPDFPATQPLGVPLELSQAAHFHLHGSIYLGGQGRMEMWLTRPDAPPITEVLKDAVDENKDIDSHVLRRRVAFVHWMPEDNGVWPPYLVCDAAAGGYEVISAAHGIQPLSSRQDYRWDNAMSWNDKVVVPTAHGVSIFHFSPRVVETHHELIPPGPATQPVREYSEPRFLLDAEGLLAWLPWEVGKTGGVGAVKYVESVSDDSKAAKTLGVWTELTPGNGWPAKLLHLVPMLDGTVLMLAVDEAGAVQIQFNTLEHSNVKQEDIEKLVDQLSDTDQEIRNAAYDKLSQYGSGIWPILEKLVPDQGPEAQTRLRQLLKQKVVPTLNGMALLGNKTLKLVARLSDGGTVFFAEAGVSIPNAQDPDGTPDYRAKAWISIRPGRPIELLPDSFTADLTPGQSRLYAVGNDWVVSNDVRGPRRFVGNGFVTLLRKSEHAFSEFIGLDRRGRWLFRRPLASTSDAGPSTLPATASATADDETLIIDPTLPDPNPRLPVWVLSTADEVGWTKDNWPVTKKNSSYALHENGWQLVKEGEKVLSKAEDVGLQIEPPPASGTTTTPSTQPAASSATLPATALAKSPATAPATAAATTSATQPGEQPILTDREGTQYFGGLADLRIVPRKGSASTWPLPAIATGEGPAWLVKAPSGRLYLFNQPGRVVRIKPAAGDPISFSVEKIFTHHIPTAKTPTRVWVDPAGRIDMIWENQLAVFFPAGYIPSSIADLMLLGGVDDDGDE